MATASVPAAAPSATSRAPLVQRLLPAAATVVGVAVLLRLVYDQYLNYDARYALLWARDLQPGTHLAAVGADSVGKQELDPEILRRAALLLVDSLAQCRKLGELQHALSEHARAVEIGAFCAAPVDFDRAGVTVADFTGLGAEDLFVAEACWAGLEPR